MPKIRVLVVDDAVVMRKMITEVLARDSQIEVIGSAPNGRIALQKIPQVNPDLITMDVEMPEMDGIETLREIRKIYPTLPVIMFSTLTAKGASTTLDALSIGATDYVTKPANVGSVTDGINRLELELIPKIKAHCKHLRAAEPPGEHTTFLSRLKTVTFPPRARSKPIDMVCVGTSTGGPNALAEVFKSFPGDFPVPIVVVQHMPPMFTALLAERLAANTAIRFHEGQHGQLVLPGHGYIAPGGKHMEVKREGLKTVLQLHEGPPENSCRPAVDVLFRSVAATYGGNVLAVVLTGMGQDGLRGCQHLREGNAQVIAQDEKSSVVWGMPGCVATAGLADLVVPLDRVGGEIVRRVKESRRACAA